MNEISKKQHCIILRGDMRVWIPSEKLENFRKAYAMARENKTLIDFENQSFNPADIVGIFEASTMEEVTRRKNGQWQCSKKGFWHDRNETCDCQAKQFRKDREDELNEKINKHFSVEENKEKLKKIKDKSFK